MSTRLRQTATRLAAAAPAAFALLLAQAASAQTVSPLPPSAYTVRAACPPPMVGHATCMAMQLIARTAAARAHTHPLGVERAAASPSGAPTPASGYFGARPQDLHGAYALPADSESPSTQTIALVDAYNDPHAEADLEAYDGEFGLPACTVSDHCFEQVNQRGETGNLPFPERQSELTSAQTLCETGSGAQAEQACFDVEEAEGWSVEISLDIETARAVCQNCHIALVEADNTEYANLEAAEETAARIGATEISNSWGGPECVGPGVCEGTSHAFDHPGVVVTASAGDDGYLGWLEPSPSGYASFPASLPQVVAVGGTRLYTSGERWSRETVWNDGGESGGRTEGYGAGGGGCSVQFAAQLWQRNVSDWSSVGCGNDRAVADVAADADPYTGLAVRDSSPECESPYEYEEKGKRFKGVLADWCTIGGTSLASPLIASVFALAGGADGVSYPSQTLYQNAVKSPGDLHDVTEGSNGACDRPFDAETGDTGCTQAQEAAASCASHLSCQAAAGYDGPTGVGTPDGLGAFEVPSGGLSVESEESGGHLEGSAPPAPAPAGPAPSQPTSPSPAAAGASVRLSGLALTLKALVALNRKRSKIASVAFSFSSNMPVSVRATLLKRAVKRHRQRWQALGRALTIAAAKGINDGHFTGKAVLGAGTYRLTLTPVGGAASSIAFKIG